MSSLDSIISAHIKSESERSIKQLSATLQKSLIKLVAQKQRVLTQSLESKFKDLEKSIIQKMGNNHNKIQKKITNFQDTDSQNSSKMQQNIVDIDNLKRQYQILLDNKTTELDKQLLLVKDQNFGYRRKYQSQLQDTKVNTKKQLSSIHWQINLIKQSLKQANILIKKQQSESLFQKIRKMLCSQVTNVPSQIIQKIQPQPQWFKKIKQGTKWQCHVLDFKKIKIKQENQKIGIGVIQWQQEMLSSETFTLNPETFTLNHHNFIYYVHDGNSSVNGVIKSKGTKLNLQQQLEIYINKDQGYIQWKTQKGNLNTIFNDSLKDKTKKWKQFIFWNEKYSQIYWI